jgi:hypothetical protein
MILIFLILCVVIEIINIFYGNKLWIKFIANEEKEVIVNSKEALYATTNILYFGTVIVGLFQSNIYAWIIFGIALFKTLFYRSNLSVRTIDSTICIILLIRWITTL